MLIKLALCDQCSQPWVFISYQPYGEWSGKSLQRQNVVDANKAWNNFIGWEVFCLFCTIAIYVYLYVLHLYLYLYIPVQFRISLLAFVYTETTVTKYQRLRSLNTRNLCFYTSYKLKIRSRFYQIWFLVKPPFPVAFSLQLHMGWRGVCEERQTLSCLLLCGYQSIESGLHLCGTFTPSLSFRCSISQ
jgi:exosortase/archaeosortase